MMPFGYKRPPYDQEKDKPDHHYEIPLLPAERDWLLDWLEDDKKPAIHKRQYLAKKIKDAPQKPGPPLPVASLDWRRAEREARDRGESVPEWIWDQPPPDRAA